MIEGHVLSTSPLSSYLSTSPPLHLSLSPGLLGGGSLPCSPLRQRGGGKQSGASKGRMRLHRLPTTLPTLSSRTSVGGLPSFRAWLQQPPLPLQWAAVAVEVLHCDWCILWFGFLINLLMNIWSYNVNLSWIFLILWTCWFSYMNLSIFS